MNAVITQKDRENDRLIEEFKRKQRDEAVRRFLRSKASKRQAF